MEALKHTFAGCAARPAGSVVSAELESTIACSGWQFRTCSAGLFRSADPFDEVGDAGYGKKKNSDEEEKAE